MHKDKDKYKKRKTLYSYDRTPNKMSTFCYLSDQIHCIVLRRITMNDTVTITST